MKGKCYKKISLTLDFEDIKVLRKLNPEINISEITRKAIKAEIKQELGLKCKEKQKKMDKNDIIFDKKQPLILLEDGILETIDSNPKTNELAKFKLIFYSFLCGTIFMGFTVIAVQIMLLLR